MSITASDGVCVWGSQEGIDVLTCQLCGLAHNTCVGSVAMHMSNVCQLDIICIIIEWSRC